MEASVRIFSSSYLSHHLSRSVLYGHSPKLKVPPISSTHLFSISSRNPKRTLFPNASSLNGSEDSIFRNRSSSCYNAVSRSSASFASNSLGFLLSLSLSLRVSDNLSNGAIVDAKEKYFTWNRAPQDVNGGDLGIFGDRGPIWTVVLLGWLGAEEKHLKRYAELYTSRGIHAVRFVIPVKDVLGFDFGRRAEKRMLALGEELVSWLSETKEDGRERCLLFHTFSNTGWFAYGVVLDYLQCRGDFMDKIKGCVVDSGGDPEINPKVWAAGFSAALLKKRSSSTLPAVGVIGHESLTHASTSNMHDNEPPLIEILLLSVLETVFSVILKSPDVNRRLAKIITILSKNQPCPQLYLYSAADRVIPFGSVEMFIKDQKSMGRKVWAYNFGSSPHVDHYRSFPHIYSTELHKFLKECVTTIGQKVK